MILAVDTSIGSTVAVVDPHGVVRAEVESTDPLAHAEVIGTLLHEALHGAGIAATDVTHVAAGMGPGPFTGLRIGVAAARAFALARKAPVLSVVSHDAAALVLLDPTADSMDARVETDAGSRDAGAARSTADSAHGPAAPHPTPFAIVTDARRREFAFTLYSGLDEAGLPVRLTEPALVPRDEIDARVAEHGATRADAARIAASDIGRIAARMLAAGRFDPHREPLYLRSPDVTLGHVPKRVSA